MVEPCSGCLGCDEQEPVYSDGDVCGVAADSGLDLSVIPVRPDLP